MNFREEIEAALSRDNTEYGQVWRGERETNKNRIWKQLNVMLERKPVKTTRAQKKRWAKRMSCFARRHCLSRTTAAEIASRAEWCIKAASHAHASSLKTNFDDPNLIDD